MSGDDFSDFANLMPDGDCIPLFGVRLISYLDADGERQFKWQASGDSTVLETVGLIEAVKMSYLHETGVLDVVTGWDDE